MKPVFSLLRLFAYTCVFSLSATAFAQALRPPAVPLVACDPYFSIWSPADTLAGADTVHWTGKPHRLSSLVRVDGKAFRLMGKDPAELPEFPQAGVAVEPTRTIYQFRGAGIQLSLTFMTPTLPDDMDLLARPVTYLTWEAKSLDGKSHSVSVYFDGAGELAVNVPQQAVQWSKPQLGGSLVGFSVGSVEQPILAKRGDDIRIDWGYFYAATEKRQASFCGTGLDRAAAQSAFAKSGDVSTVSASQGTSNTVGCLVLDLGQVDSQPVKRWLVVAYDDLYSIQYMKKNLRPYWRRNGWDAVNLLKASAREYAALERRCAAFDMELLADLTAAGGSKYAAISALAYRQCFAAGKFVADEKGRPLQFSKENHSNGCIGTSDVFYPMAPQFLLFGPTVAKSFLVPFMHYAASERWKFPFAPHDLGQYPHANGQVYGGGERTEENQMPVEESGNLLILMAAVATMEGKADFAALYWPTLEKWAEYLKAKGFDPENQLCTDDFAGHLAHNVNLSAKAILGLASFARLCEMRGKHEQAAEYFSLARSFAAQWVKEADGGEKFRLAYDKPGTWSQKYNLIWDRILNLNVFPAEVARKEMAFYRKIQNRYGLPLDNRQTYTKLDWIVWTATLTQNREDFEALVNPVYLFLHETPDRSPMTDWYQTVSGKKVGFTARPVVGGVFVPLLYNQDVWQKYARRDRTRASRWAPMPQLPKVTALVPAADREPGNWRYTTTQPGEGWFRPEFDASKWAEGRSGFGTRGTPGAVIGTRWDGPAIWMRKEFALPNGRAKNVQLWIHHDEDAEVYINGQRVLSLNGYSMDYEAHPLKGALRTALKPGRNIIAVHCRQTSGGQYIDVGLVEITPQ